MATNEQLGTASLQYEQDEELLMQEVPLVDMARVYWKARNDLSLLRINTKYGNVYKAGNMHYGYLFGRDLCVITEDNKDLDEDNTLIESNEEYPFGAYEPLDSSPIPALLTLRDLQGKHTDFYNEEMFGKILHEEVAGREHWAYEKSRREPGRPLYSTVDASFRALRLAVTSWDEALAYDQAYPQHRAPERIADLVSGILTYAKARQDEFKSQLVYDRRRNPDDYSKIHGVMYADPQTPANLDWRDSGDSEQVSSGYTFAEYTPAIDPQSEAFDIESYRAQKIGATILRNPKVPAAYLNVQALLWNSIEHFDDRMLAKMTDEGRALVQEFKLNNPSLKQAILDDFATDDGYYGYVLGRDGTLYDADTTDPVVLMALGITDKETNDRIRDKIFSLETFLTPYGVRSLSRQEPGFDAYSYHNGSVWIHDNVKVISAFIAGGYVKEAKVMLHALLRGILELEDKSSYLNLYELFCVPVEHPQTEGIRPYKETSGRDACSIQGWAASGLRRTIKVLYPEALTAGLTAA